LPPVPPPPGTGPGFDLATAVDAVLQTPRWLQFSEPDPETGHREWLTASYRKAKTAQILRAYLDRGWPVESVDCWCRQAAIAKDPPAYLYSMLDLYGRQGKRPTKKDGKLRQLHQAILKGDEAGRVKWQAMEISYAREQEAKAKAEQADADLQALGAALVEELEAAPDLPEPTRELLEEDECRSVLARIFHEDPGDHLATIQAERMKAEEAAERARTDRARHDKPRGPEDEKLLEVQRAVRQDHRQALQNQGLDYFEEDAA